MSFQKLIWVQNIEIQCHKMPRLEVKRNSTAFQFVSSFPSCGIPALFSIFTELEEIEEQALGAGIFCMPVSWIWDTTSF